MHTQQCRGNLIYICRWKQMHSYHDCSHLYWVDLTIDMTIDMIPITEPKHHNHMYKPKMSEPLSLLPKKRPHLASVNDYLGHF